MFQNFRHNLTNRRLLRNTNFSYFFNHGTPSSISLAHRTFCQKKFVKNINFTRRKTKVVSVTVKIERNI